MLIEIAKLAVVKSPGSNWRGEVVGSAGGVNALFLTACCTLNYPHRKLFSPWVRNLQDKGLLTYTNYPVIDKRPSKLILQVERPTRRPKPLFSTARYKWTSHTNTSDVPIRLPLGPRNIKCRGQQSVLIGWQWSSACPDCHPSPDALLGPTWQYQFNLHHF